MASKHEIIGEEWKQRAPELTESAMEFLVNRKDVWGQYSVLTPSERIKEGRSYKRPLRFREKTCVEQILY